MRKTLAYLCLSSLLSFETLAFHEGGVPTLRSLPTRVEWMDRRDPIVVCSTWCGSGMWNVGQQQQGLYHSRSSTRLFLGDMASYDSFSDGALEYQDLVDGTILAFVLAFSYSYLNRNASNVVLWKQEEEEDEDWKEREMKRTVFNEEAWKDISRPENYVYFNKRQSSQGTPDIIGKKENRKVLIALLILFTPLFSAEFFLALSRQFLCGGDAFSQSDIQAYLCSPH
mmetsp:Transcript_10459/g.13609  ORF Transcript_10459/g.13609 Transcript_10459/m.13609 type:complete len:226 (+) Transcript_10459:95-772(+)|eukprot:CAMPEP_0116060126 /NCGR_PEP_ID=MMETSP0322-20121206/6221_1 /TAXON_ID=163516 /ORGANISM="Leptocylindrus danicus var. apora, Strain B651" /LENGTH=225 /DNA_ID=CAMNT_0003544669 /DNA_START=55 /DNA_END=732 /DNA_ORIENTATION=+